LNSVCIDQNRVWAREARFDRFAHNDVSVQPSFISVKESEVKVRQVVRKRGEGVKKVSWGNVESGENGEGDKTVTIGRVEVPVGGVGGKKMRRVGEVSTVTTEGVVDNGKGIDERVEGAKEDGGGKPLFWCVNVETELRKDRPEVVKGALQQKQNSDIHFILVFHSNQADRMWASNNMVASVIEGDSSLALQHRVEDADFSHVIVTPMGGERVFLHCSDGGDIWKLFNHALHFFGMLFGNIKKWSASDVRYERGAWVCAYGVPIHAWNDGFFRLCVSDTGRFIRTDECTVDKAQLDFACVL